VAALLALTGRLRLSADSADAAVQLPALLSSAQVM
jgi:hypothetical protein